MSERKTKRQKYRNLLGSVGVYDPDYLTSDNLSILLATYFTDLPECPVGNEDEETGWSKWAMKKTDEVLDVVVDEIIMPLEDKIEELEAKLNAAETNWSNEVIELNKKIEELEAVANQECEWNYPRTWDDGTWKGECGLLWEFLSDGPEENDMKFCPKCGGKVVIKEPENE